MLPRGTSDAVAAANRAQLAGELGFTDIMTPRLIHGGRVWFAEHDFDFEHRPEADAIVTDRPGSLIGVATADCVAVLLYDPRHHVVAAVHSGWRGTAANISRNTIRQFVSNYRSRPGELMAYISPAPALAEYEVGSEVAELFAQKYTTTKGDGTYWFDNKLAVYDQLLAAGLAAEHIEVSSASSYELEFHSYRRDGGHSGRHMAVIGLKNG
jgi:YfiH family protein